jgi:hypothetical protein
MKLHTRSAGWGYRAGRPGDLTDTPFLRKVLVTVLGDTANLVASWASDHPAL